MRQLTSFDQQETALRFCAYLITLGIDASVDNAGDKWSVWVRDEDQLERAMEELKTFLGSPLDSRYKDVEVKAKAIQQEKEDARKSANKNVVAMSGNWSQGTNRRTQLVTTLAIISGIVFVFTDLASTKTPSGHRVANKFERSLHFRDIQSSIAYEIETKKTDSFDIDSLDFRLNDIKKGQIWRAVTPIFIHYGFLHIIFNTIMLFHFGPQIENKIGTVKFGLLVLLIALVTNILQGIMPVDWEGSYGSFGGLSGVVYGLFGFVWIKAMTNPWEGYFVQQSTVIILVVWMFLGMTHLLDGMMGGPTGNWAHGAGLVTGMATAYFPLFPAGGRKRNSKK